MKKIIGIYRITNLNNNKCYIGQSRNVLVRWKQHTQGLKHTESVNLSLIRRAFVKYGLKIPVSSTGVFNGFRFEIIEECTANALLEREQYHIQLEKPEYNLSFMPPNSDYIFKAKSKNQSRFWMQYHNIDKEQSYPGHIWDEEEKKMPMIETRHYISTQKRCVINILGDTILMITGLKGIKTKDYFAWSVMVVEELEFFENEDLPYNVIGEQKFFHTPIILNKIEGFNEFFHRQGHFAFGLHNVAKDPWIVILQKLLNDGPFVTDEKLSWADWIKAFEDQNGIEWVESSGPGND
jgi:group I intron endonuclease